MSARAAGQTRRAAWLLLALCTLCASVAAQMPAAPAARAAAAGAPAKDDAKVQPTRGEDKDVIQATERFLKLIDAGQYGDAWDGGAAPLKSSVTRQGFIDGLGKIRQPLGKVASRTPGHFARAHEMPNGPEGDYALVSYVTRFASGKTAEEQVVWLLESKDAWRVSGYFIR